MLVERMPDVRMAGEVSWRPWTGMFGPARLPLAFGRAARGGGAAVGNVRRWACVDPKPFTDVGCAAVVVLLRKCSSLGTPRHRNKRHPLDQPVYSGCLRGDPSSA